MKLAIGLDQQIDPTLDGEHGDRRQSDEQRERREKRDQARGHVPVGIDRQALKDVAERQAKQQREPDLRNGEDAIPGRSPVRPFLLGAELERYGAQDQHEQDERECEVEPGEQRGVDEREHREQHAPADHEPDLVAVPDRADAVEEGPPLVVGPGQGDQKDPDAHVEPIEDQVARDDEDEEEEPDVVEGHFDSPASAARGRRLKMSRNVSGSVPTATVSTSSSSSGPSWILRLRRYRKSTSNSP